MICMPSASRLVVPVKQTASLRYTNRNARRTLAIKTTAAAKPESGSPEQEGIYDKNPYLSWLNNAAQVTTNVPKTATAPASPSAPASTNETNETVLYSSESQGRTWPDSSATSAYKPPGDINGGPTDIKARNVSTGSTGSTGSLGTGGGDGDEGRGGSGGRGGGGSGGSGDDSGAGSPNWFLGFLVLAALGAGVWYLMRKPVEVSKETVDELAETAGKDNGSDDSGKVALIALAIAAILAAVAKAALDKQDKKGGKTKVTTKPAATAATSTTTAATTATAATTKPAVTVTQTTVKPAAPAAPAAPASLI